MRYTKLYPYKHSTWYDWEQETDCRATIHFLAWSVRGHRVMMPVLEVVILGNADPVLYDSETPPLRAPKQSTPNPVSRPVN